ncbi:hypothetical protein EYF80_055591 [Liparis tanakae]|uniref:Uncharacterized protein n=1 Tax=Liparis tanakae TaxID=230148 RepID=A0A4Z2EZ41_9TELE|nr:hypothetical protein EYF80_055591 [Liparis tanakae]
MMKGVWTEYSGSSIRLEVSGTGSVVEALGPHRNYTHKWREKKDHGWSSWDRTGHSSVRSIQLYGEPAKGIGCKRLLPLGYRRRGYRGK